MSLIVEITEATCLVVPAKMKQIKPTALFIEWNWPDVERGEKWITPTDDTFDWDGAFIHDLVLFADAGITGEVEIMDEYGCYILFRLEEGTVKEFYGEVIYPNTPAETHRLHKEKETEE